MDGRVAAALFLASPRGREALAAARAVRGEDPLARRKALEGRFPPGEIRAALAQDDLRARAAEKTPLADVLLFSRDALEQATPSEVADERARRFAGHREVADLGAGIGLDAIALALAGLRVTAVERDPERAALLAHNVAAAGVADRVAVREGDALADPPRADAAFLDPDRRPGGRRTRDPERFEPPPAAWETLARRYAALLVKLPPVTRPADHAGRGLEWVSLRGRMRECRLGFGALATEVARRALLLPSGVRVEGTGRPWPAPRAPRPGDVLLDPDPAVVVADLVGDAAASVGAAPVHPRIAYLLGDRPAPWATSLLVEEVLPAAAAAVQAWLDAHDVGDLEIRCRGVEDPPDAWRRRLRPRGRSRRTLVLARGPDDRYLALGVVPVVGSTGGGAPRIP